MLDCKWIKILTVLAIVAMPIGISRAAEGFFPGQKKVVSWREALKKANMRVDNEGTASVLGTRVGEYVRRLHIQAEEHKKVKDFFESLRAKNTPQTLVSKCQANYDVIKQTANENKLFANYGLTAVSPADFCNLSAEELASVKRFFQNRQPLSQARQYKKALLLTLSTRPAVLQLVVTPKDKMIILNYNAPKDLETLEELQSSWKELSVY